MGSLLDGGAFKLFTLYLFGEMFFFSFGLSQGYTKNLY
jgi:hypothetical protein